MILPTPDLSNDMWQQTDSLVLPPGALGPGGGLQRVAAGFMSSLIPGVAVETDSGRTGLGHGVTRSISCTRGIQNITRHSTAQPRPPSAQSQQSIAESIYCRRRGPPSRPTLQTSRRIGERVSRTAPSPQHFTSYKLPPPHKTADRRPVPLAT